MANTKISALTALTGANVTTSTDVIPIVDTSVGTTKKILVDELSIGMVSAPKAWASISHPTTVNDSYPTVGVSNTNPSTGDYLVTHGKTFSSSNYVIVITPLQVSGRRIWRITQQNATTFTVHFQDETGVDQNITSFGYALFGTLA